MIYEKFAKPSMHDRAKMMQYLEFASKIIKVDIDKSAENNRLPVVITYDGEKTFSDSATIGHEIKATYLAGCHGCYPFMLLIDEVNNKDKEFFASIFPTKNNIFNEEKETFIDNNTMGVLYDNETGKSKLCYVEITFENDIMHYKVL